MKELNIKSLKQLNISPFKHFNITMLRLSGCSCTTRSYWAARSRLTRSSCHFDIHWGNRFQCLTPRCPTKSYDGFWELPTLRLINPENGRMCAFHDDCVVSLRTPNDAYRLLYLNFRHHYDTNRAPMMINLATKTLKNKVAVAGLKMFLQTIVSDGHDDTFLVTLQDVIAWMESPQPISKVEGCEDTLSGILIHSQKAEGFHEYRCVLVLE